MSKCIAHQPTSKFTISNAKYDAEGSRTAFYTIGRGRGFKTFFSKEEAEIARSYQMILWKGGYGPKVYSEVGRIVIHPGALSPWGYITQKVKTLGCSNGCDDCKKCIRDTYEYCDDLEGLQDSVYEECGLRVGDLHIGNVGLIGDKLVVIDAGIESFSGEFA